MGGSFSRKAAAGGVFAGLSLLALTVLVQTKALPQDSGGRQSRILPAPATDEARNDPATERLVQSLRQLRRGGNEAEAGLVFRELFPAPGLAGPGAGVAGTLFFSQGGLAAPEQKRAAVDPAIPVLATLDDERHPSIDRRLPPGGRPGPEVFVAAEFLSGAGSSGIAVVKSGDSGATWPVSVALAGNGSRSQPSLRQISPDDLGLIYRKSGGGPDSGVYFARIPAGFDRVEETAVNTTGRTGGKASLASDFAAYPSPYVYAAYSERTDLGYRVRVRVSRDLGRTWSGPVTAAEFACPLDIACDTAVAFDPQDSSLTLAFVGWQSGLEGIAVTRSRSFGSKWSPAVFLSDPEAGPCSSPGIAAASGSALVVYEQALSDSRGEVCTASYLRGAGWTAGKALALGRSPDVRTSGTGTSGVFYLSYVQGDSRIVLRESAASRPSDWSAAADIKREGTVVEGGPVALLPADFAGSQTPIVAWTDASSDFDVVIMAPMTLTVTPGDSGVSNTEGTTSFSVTKTGPGKMDWTAEVTSGADWLSITAGASGVNSGTITAAFTANIAPNIRVGAITVTAPAAVGSPVTVTVTQAGAPQGTLTVTPAEGLVSTGPLGGPFTPANIAYTLENVGSTALSWTASANQAWLTASPASGALDPGGTATVIVSINNGSNALASGTYSGVVSFVNITNGNGTTTRPVSLTVAPPLGALSVSPAGGLTSSGIVGGPFAPASIVYTLTNTGGTALDWTAGRTQIWVTVSAASGTLAAGGSTTVSVSINSAANSLAAGSYSDTVAFTNVTNGGGSTTRPVALTVSPPLAALTVTPAEGFSSAGTVGGPFTPSSKNYVLGNSGGTAIDWTAAKTKTWLTVLPASGTIVPGSTTTVTVSINGGANALSTGLYSDVVTFTNTTNGSGTTTRAVSLAVNLPPATPSATPGDGLVSAGPTGGPFAPAGKDFVLENTGGTILNWSAAVSQPWTSISSAGGSLMPGAKVTVTVSVNSGANTLSPGSYGDTVSFTNLTNGNGNTTRSIVLTVDPPPGALVVSPAEGVIAYGPQGGPFAPTGLTYTLRNSGGSALTWSAAKTQDWVSLSSVGGTLAAGATATVTVSFNAAANLLAPGTYNDLVAITNETNGSWTTTRPVSLTVGTLPSLSVAPADRAVSSVPGNATFSVANTGGGTMNWTAAVVNAPWMVIQSGSVGKNAGTITVACQANNAALPRQGIVRVTAPGAVGSPVDVTVTQSGGFAELTVSGERFTEKVWIIQRDYARLTVRIRNPTAVQIDKLAVSRKAAGEGYRVTLTAPWASSLDGLIVLDDVGLVAGKSYTLKVSALDALGNVICESNEVDL